MVDVVLLYLLGTPLLTFVMHVIIFYYYMRYQNERLVKEQLTNANFKNRIADKVAVVEKTAKLINDCMGFMIDTKKIQELVIEYCCGLKQSAGIGERPFNDIMQALISNQKCIQYDSQYVEANLIGFFDASNTEYLVVDVIVDELVIERLAEQAKSVEIGESAVEAVKTNQVSKRNELIKTIEKQQVELVKIEK